MAIMAISILMLATSSRAKANEEVSVPKNPIVTILEEEESIYEFDIPDDILKNLSTAPASLKKPSTSTTHKSTGKSTTANTNTTKPKQNANTAPAVKKKVTLGKVEGYRVQVFSDGSNPATLQTRAKARGNAIVAKFPKYRGQVYSFSSSPNWYTRVGNFRTQEEASKALSELKRAFPAFAAEMRVVKSVVTGVQ